MVTGEEKIEVPKMVWETKSQIPMDGKLKIKQKDSVFIRRNVSFDEQGDALAKKDPEFPDVRGTAGEPDDPGGGLVRETADDPVDEDINNTMSAKKVDTDYCQQESQRRVTHSSRLMPSATTWGLLKGC